MHAFDCVKIWVVAVPDQPPDLVMVEVTRVVLVWYVCLCVQHACVRACVRVRVRVCVCVCEASESACVRAREWEGGGGNRRTGRPNNTKTAAHDKPPQRTDKMKCVGERLSPVLSLLLRRAVEATTFATAAALTSRPSR